MPTTGNTNTLKTVAVAAAVTTLLLLLLLSCTTYASTNKNSLASEPWLGLTTADNCLIAVTSNLCSLSKHELYIHNDTICILYIVKRLATLLREYAHKWPLES